MGNCLPNSTTKSTAEISPVTTAKPTSTVTVKLTGPPNSLSTSYLRYALLHKKLNLRFVPSEDDEKPTIHVGAETVSGSREVLLRYIEDKFPEPPRLALRKFNLEEGFDDEATPPIVKAIWLQHRSVTWHVERMVRWSEDIAARGGRRAVDPSVGTPKMEIRKFAKSYGQLLEVMVEHAQMEERVLFPLLESVDRGNNNNN